MRSLKINEQGNPIERTKLYDFDAIKKAKEIMETDPSEHLVISRLADKAGINEFKLKIGFKEIFGISPYKYLIKIRLDRAKLLLEETDYTIREIADKVGFGTYNGFSMCFRNAFGVLPSQYRNSI